MDSNLTVDGNVSWYEELGHSLLMVTGNLRCRNLFISGCPKIVVRGDLILENGVLGEYGDDGGVLEVGGNTKANIILSMTYFQMYFAKQPEAVVIVTNGDANCEADYDDDASLEAVLPQYIDDGRLDGEAIGEALIDGHPILRPTAVSASQKWTARLNALLEHADDVTSLSIDEQKLATIPPQVFSFPNLRELDLTRHPTTEILELKHLKSLDIRNSHFTQVPEIIGQISSLEELYIEDFTELPESLANLTRLKTLFVSRCRAEEFSTDQLGKLKSLTKLTLELLPTVRYSDELLNLTELTYLEIKFDCTPLTDFPDLSRLPKLKTLVLDGYPLPNADSNWQEAHRLTLQGAGLLSSDHKKALKSFEKALSCCKPGKRYYDFDQLYSLYGCVYCLANMIPSASEGSRDKLIKANIKYSEQALEIADMPGTIWIFTQEGAFHLEVNRYAGNELGWWLMMKGELDRALEAIERAAECVQTYSH